MRRRHIFQIEELHLVRRRVNLTGHKVGVGGNLNTVLGQPLPYLRLIRHRSEQAGVRFPLIAPAGPAIQGGLKGVVVRGAPVGAQQDEPREVAGQSHHPQRGLDREDLLIEREACPCDTLLLR